MTLFPINKCVCERFVLNEWSQLFWWGTWCCNEGKERKKQEPGHFPPSNTGSFAVTQTVMLAMEAMEGQQTCRNF